jgi:hypothetical protein
MYDIYAAPFYCTWMTPCRHQAIQQPLEQAFAANSDGLTSLQPASPHDDLSHPRSLVLSLALCMTEGGLLRVSYMYIYCLFAPIAKPLKSC